MRLPLLALALLATAASAQGRLDFDGTDHDMGRLTESEPGRHAFAFLNAGDAPVELVEVESNCGCTVPSFPSGAVAPGGTGEIAVVYDTRGRPGPFEKAVRVTTDAGQAVTLRLSGVVEPALAVGGVRLGALAFETLDKDLGVLAAGSALQTSIQFANVGARPVRVERVDAPAGVEVVFPSRPVFPDHLGGVFVTVEAPARLAATDGELVVPLTLHTTDPDEPVKRLTVRATQAGG